MLNITDFTNTNFFLLLLVNAWTARNLHFIGFYRFLPQKCHFIGFWSKNCHFIGFIGYIGFRGFIGNVATLALFPKLCWFSLKTLVYCHKTQIETNKSFTRQLMVELSLTHLPINACSTELANFLSSLNWEVTRLPWPACQFYTI